MTSYDWGSLTSSDMKRVLMNSASTQLKTKKRPALSPNTRSKNISSRLLRRILDGVYPAGSKLPTERVLASEFGVARTIVREALKRIEAMNLLTIRQGSGALVEDFRMVGGIELADLLMVDSNGKVDVEFLKDVGRVHEGVHTWVVKLAAKHITTEEIRALKALLQERSSMQPGDERLPTITLEITRDIVRASHNRYICLLFNTLARTTAVSRTVFEAPSFNPDIQTFFGRLVEAFEKRDEEMAMLLVKRVFESSEESYVSAIARLSMCSSS